VFLVSRYGSATVRFTERRIFHLTQVSQLSSRLATTITVVAVAVIVVVVAVADAERTSNCKLYIYRKGQVITCSFFCVLS
jgi:hypothetical protein